MSVEVLLENIYTEIGESPHWDEATRNLYFVDQYEKLLLCWNYDTKEVNIQQLPVDKPVGFIIPRQHGGFVIGIGKTVCLFDWETKTLRVIAEVEKGHNTSINDAKCDTRGRLWFGTESVVEPPCLPKTGMGSLYCLHNDRRLKKYLENQIGCSNGIVWASDNKSMYYIDLSPRKVYEFDYDLENGEISNQKIAIDFEMIGTIGYPDGMTIDIEDKIWVACFSVGKVVRFDPKTGEQLHVIWLPTKYTTSCVFGGPYYNELFITSAKKFATEEELANQPLSGSIFRVTGLGMTGTKSRKFIG